VDIVSPATEILSVAVFDNNLPYTHQPKEWCVSITSQREQTTFSKQRQYMFFWGLLLLSLYTCHLSAVVDELHSK
jgi:hypothetical protein